eukprot:m.154674 g.154674  ORF g.154674 m.154674 type:complete len:63 (+) comp10195_c0_seq3:2316-2504(+)
MDACDAMALLRRHTATTATASSACDARDIAQISESASQSTARGPVLCEQATSDAHCLLHCCS